VSARSRQCKFLPAVLERDAFDEPAHFGLVSVLDAAGGHGEARRGYEVYCARMDVIGVESAPPEPPPWAERHEGLSRG